jgi:hypothetical protein
MIRLDGMGWDGMGWDGIVGKWCHSRVGEMSRERKRGGEGKKRDWRVKGKAGKWWEWAAIL